MNYNEFKCASENKSEPKQQPTTGDNQTGMLTR